MNLAFGVVFPSVATEIYLKLSTKIFKYFHVKEKQKNVYKQIFFMLFSDWYSNNRKSENNQGARKHTEKDKICVNSITQTNE